jgi:hypothetical protein
MKPNGILTILNWHDWPQETVRGRNREARKSILGSASRRKNPTSETNDQEEDN